MEMLSDFNVLQNTVMVLDGVSGKISIFKLKIEEKGSWPSDKNEAWKQCLFSRYSLDFLQSTSVIMRDKMWTYFERNCAVSADMKAR